MDRPRVSARRALERGKASNYIRPIEAIQPGDRVVLWCRVSTRWQQERKGNLDDQEANLRRVAEERGATVVDVARHVVSGCANEDEYHDLLDRLADAAELATQHGAKLLAENTSRLIRHPSYDSNPTAQARELDLRELRRATEGVVLVTHLDPDATPRQEQKYHEERGKREREARAGGQRKRSRATRSGNGMNCCPLW